MASCCSHKSIPILRFVRICRNAGTWHPVTASSRTQRPPAHCGRGHRDILRSFAIIITASVKASFTNLAGEPLSHDRSQIQQRHLILSRFESFGCHPVGLQLDAFPERSRRVIRRKSDVAARVRYLGSRRHLPIATLRCVGEVVLCRRCALPRRIRPSLQRLPRAGTSAWPLDFEPDHLDSASARRTTRS